jgi:hypothetical protein
LSGLLTYLIATKRPGSVCDRFSAVIKSQFVINFIRSTNIITGVLCFLLTGDHKGIYEQNVALAKLVIEMDPRYEYKWLSDKFFIDAMSAAIKVGVSDDGGFIIAEASSHVGKLHEANGTVANCLSDVRVIVQIILMDCLSLALLGEEYSYYQPFST